MNIRAGISRGRMVAGRQSGEGWGGVWQTKAGHQRDQETWISRRSQSGSMSDQIGFRWSQSQCIPQQQMSGRGLESTFNESIRWRGVGVRDPGASFIPQSVRSDGVIWWIGGVEAELVGQSYSRWN